ncbi:hypothetical protein M427DRAFT_157913 [Gonapodya prolifera JEL478]|uniref:Uncharacterized protein n=1 Tax=Gonapodya prolifera (strain JEL478) TaxID=1344416 RepID=A0A139A5U5_GONPJ|nr:hypothetical protein M427DRAFT_157913 [Gonapodya prolifera JEL478]|eukprot:KXS11855.1 hypothetical protein M427DRAFT_157913 [Gonapodya prolifera JEL478]
MSASPSASDDNVSVIPPAVALLLKHGSEGNSDIAVEDVVQGTRMTWPFRKSDCVAIVLPAQPTASTLPGSSTASVPPLSTFYALETLFAIIGTLRACRTVALFTYTPDLPHHLSSFHRDHGTPTPPPKPGQRLPAPSPRILVQPSHASFAVLPLPSVVYGPDKPPHLHWMARDKTRTARDLVGRGMEVVDEVLPVWDEKAGDGGRWAVWVGGEKKGVTYAKFERHLADAQRGASKAGLNIEAQQIQKSDLGTANVILTVLAAISKGISIIFSSRNEPAVAKVPRL